VNLKAAVELHNAGTSDGALKGWDTRGRSNHSEWQHGVHLGIFNRPEQPNQHAHNVGRYFPQPVPSKSERERIARAFKDAKFVGMKQMNLSDLTPLQKTILQRLTDRVAQKMNDPAFVGSKVPGVFNFEGKNYIVDGHHRLAYEAAAGAGATQVRHFVHQPTVQ
jgi:hypothetical protein